MIDVIFEAIEHHKLALSDHTFCQNLRSSQNGNRRAYSFVPHMAFFVLGFKDMLKNLQVQNPKNSVDNMLNHHCQEDSDHWQWFLEDLKTLKLGIDKWGGDIGSALGLIWSDFDFPVRNQVYRVMHYLFQCRSTHEKLILVECLEAAFAAFVINLNHLTQRSGQFDSLKYFGRHHFEEESSHAMGSWLSDGGKLPVASDSSYQIRADTMLAMVDDIFAGFNQVFSIWEKTWIEEAIPQAA
ncbi:MAG: hypothetical protein EOO07_39345 [Chitinophagaceae bacterium]|nr:MAG: hypothetical protein EOO07_39345 [Chitinophagaceae bacterium]